LGKGGDWVRQDSVKKKEPEIWIHWNDGDKVVIPSDKPRNLEYDRTVKAKLGPISPLVKDWEKHL